MQPRFGGDDPGALRRAGGARRTLWLFAHRAGCPLSLDVIGSRMVAERNVAYLSNDPRYRVLFNEARDQLRAALAKACGTSLAECAKSSVKDDPRRDPAMRDFTRFTMTYDLPRQTGPQPRPQVPKWAEVLLEAACRSCLRPSVGR